MYRQGDVWIFPVEKPTVLGDTIPRLSGNLVLVEGEAKGHRHRIEADGPVMYALPNTNDRFLEIMNTSGVALVHETHEKISISPGFYNVRIQRQYLPKAKPQPVLD